MSEQVRNEVAPPTFRVRPRRRLSSRRLNELMTKVYDCKEHIELLFFLWHLQAPYSVMWYKVKWWVEAANLDLLWALRAPFLEMGPPMLPLPTHPDAIGREERAAGGLPRCKSLPNLTFSE